MLPAIDNGAEGEYNRVDSLLPLSGIDSVSPTVI
jgi:hypothetical protein